MRHGPRLAIAIETTLGWRTVRQNWIHFYPGDLDLLPIWIDIDLPATGMGSFKYARGKLLHAMQRIQMSGIVNRQLRKANPDVALIGNMALNLVLGRSGMPMFTMLDATQIQLQSFGSKYGIYPSKVKRLESFKHSMRCRTYDRCVGIFSFSNWAKKSLVTHYGIDPAKIHVIPQGVAIDRWEYGAQSDKSDKVCNILFVGGDFWRKGGGVLLDWAARTKDRNWHLHIVTQDHIDLEDNRITVYHGIQPGDGKLSELFTMAHLFALPTFADCSPSAVMEALASGLPVITSQVGGVPEMIIEGTTGFAIPAAKMEMLDSVLSLLINDPALRIRMGAAAREDAEARFDAKKNIKATLDLIAAAV
jgi:glycosyltransferase involved in cell wall biosynthesis